MEQEDRFNVGLFGRVLGTTTGWSYVDDLHIVYYDFIPANDCEIPVTSALSIDYEKGEINTENAAFKLSSTLTRK